MAGEDGIPQAGRAQQHRREEGGLRAGQLQVASKLVQQREQAPGSGQNDRACPPGIKPNAVRERMRSNPLRSGGSPDIL